MRWTIEPITSPTGSNPATSRPAAAGADSSDVHAPPCRRAAHPLGGHRGQPPPVPVGHTLDIQSRRATTHRKVLWNR